MNPNSKEIEKFLKKLPEATVKKIKKLKVAQNLVLIDRKNNYIKEVGTSNLIEKADWDFTLPELEKLLHVSRPWLYSNLRGKVRYIYINNFDLETLSIFYNKPIKEIYYYRSLATIHLNTHDVVKWFNNSFFHGKRSIVTNAKRVFGEQANQILLNYALSCINHLNTHMNDLNEKALNSKLWNLCCEAPSLNHTSEYPIVELPLKISASHLKKIQLHTLKEYTYSATGMRMVITSGAEIFKSRKGKNAKMLFTLPNNEPFDTSWLNQQLTHKLEGTSYTPRLISDTVTAIENMFVVPAVQFYKEFPNKR